MSNIPSTLTTSDSTTEVHELLKKPSESSLPTISEVRTAIRAYERSKRLFGIKSINKLKKQLPHFIKIAWQSNRLGTHPDKYVEESVNSLIKNRNTFPLLSSLHSDGVAEWTGNTSPQIDEYTLGTRRAEALAKEQCNKPLNSDEEYQVAINRIRKGTFSHAGFDFTYIRIRRAQVGEQLPEWYKQSLKQYEHLERLSLANPSLSGGRNEIEDIEIHDDLDSGGEYVKA